MSDIWDDPEVQAWQRRAVEELAPMIQQSALTVSLVPKGPADVKFAVELGFSIMMGKPIILIVTPGVEIPGKLVAVADEIVELASPLGQGDPEAVGRQIQEAVARVQLRLIAEESDE